MKVGLQHDGWTDAKKATSGMRLREAANKAGMSVEFGFCYCYLNGLRTEYRHVRELIGERLLKR